MRGCGVGPHVAEGVGRALETSRTQTGVFRTGPADTERVDGGDRSDGLLLRPSHYAPLRTPRSGSDPHQDALEVGRESEPPRVPGQPRLGPDARIGPAALGGAG